MKIWLRASLAVLAAMAMVFFVATASADSHAASGIGGILSGHEPSRLALFGVALIALGTLLRRTKPNPSNE